ncbi:NUDIX hydrolase [Belnapia sp. T6]|uniref:GDP-mannose pyrophosphatase n=1 Tax=Belnapia mucosa TaxID=2804532 RepID=A0ABS1V3K6_9PROT|nr:NUDIX hydrolase [Belnapia mucosa]MBL6455706.1 NUDIX hydrolase [Belnapia mucosa]
MTVRPWRWRGDRTVHRDRWVHLRAEAWETAGGTLLDPWYRLDWPGLVHVVALTPEDRLVLVRQFRPGAGAAILELPGGMMEPEETDPVAAGRREFEEETGYAAGSFRLAATLRNDPAHAGNLIHAVLAEGAIPGGAQALDHGEEIAVEELPIATVLAGLAEGVIGNANHVGILLLALRAAGRLSF